jgi:hypothetical protein
MAFIRCNYELNILGQVILGGTIRRILQWRGFEFVRMHVVSTFAPTLLKCVPSHLADVPLPEVFATFKSSTYHLFFAKHPVSICRFELLIAQRINPP